MAVRAAVAVPRRRWRQPALAACTRSALALPSDRWAGVGSDSWAHSAITETAAATASSNWEKKNAEPLFGRAERVLLLGSPDARALARIDQCVSLRRMSRIRLILSFTSSVSCLSILRGLSWSSSRLAMNDVSVLPIAIALLFDLLQGLYHVEDDSALVCCLLFGDWSEDWHGLFMKGGPAIASRHPLRFRLTRFEPDRLSI